MHIVDVNEIVGNAFVKDYLRGEEKAVNYFHGNIHKADAFKEQVAYLKNRIYDRDSLVGLLKEYHAQFEVGEKTYEHIEALKEADTYVAISGQQAGLLTGPMYTMYKIITTIQLAKQQSKKLGVKVIPVFWVAGEDHDFLEVNHVYVQQEDRVVKKSYPVMNKKKNMVTDISLDKQKCAKWVHDVFSSFGETEYTKDVLSLVERTLETSTTFTQFFAQLILTIFKNEGLVLIDSGYRPFRNLQIPYLQKIVRNHKEIQCGLANTQENHKNAEYLQALHIKETAIHLFYEQDGERHLLHQLDEDTFTCNDGNVVFTKESLLEEIRQHPSLFSNNVVTRPLVQEWMFPTLAFVGGPGELAYWGELKEVFEAVDLKMPLVLPRLSFTIIERNVQTYLNELNVTIEDVLANKMEERKKEVLMKDVTVSLDVLFQQVEEQIANEHKRLQNELANDFPHLQAYGMKNSERIINELATYKKMIEKDIRRKHDVLLHKYDVVANKLYPLGAPQERIFNVMYYLNLYGMDFVSRLAAKEISVDFQHKLIVM
ncbi:MAG: bacillithiol biosynthesis cysteine-adding enzyme BshC [Bacillaceae bacterium]